MKANSSFLTKDQFVALLRESGITEPQMQTLHRLFEQRHPEAHTVFLRNLQLDEPTIAQIREKSRIG